MPEQVNASLEIRKAPYGTTAQGQPVTAYTLSNDTGMEVCILNYGGTITSIKVPDKNKQLSNVVLGFDTLAEYENSQIYAGGIVGRCCGRIAKSQFCLDGHTYMLDPNAAPHHLHGGSPGFNKVLWQAQTSQTNDSVSLSLYYLSPTGEGGYPGNLDTTVCYTLKNDNSLSVRYKATTDTPTVINLTQHSYFNLSGKLNTPITEHALCIAADAYIPIDPYSIPLGNLEPVANSPFDFRKPKTIDQDLHEPHEQLINGQGYDHCWALEQTEQSLSFAASCYEPNSGRLLEVYTSQPGLQVYTGNYLGSETSAEPDKKFAHRSGLCFETQDFPDAVHHSQFPSVVLRPGEVYERETRFVFSS